ncbi:uncharacterized protein LOC141907078 [Tubulanus polymorphus]|uniref:uncharacterized protein LOC141907078 n=1 Tax=Tubulanus polymorphus TaxID=672921 RepID=UPI003DA27403
MIFNYVGRRSKTLLYSTFLVVVTLTKAASSIAADNATVVGCFQDSTKRPLFKAVFIYTYSLERCFEYCKQRHYSYAASVKSQIWISGNCKENLDGGIERPTTGDVPVRVASCGGNNVCLCNKILPPLTPLDGAVCQNECAPETEVICDATSGPAYHSILVYDLEKSHPRNDDHSSIEQSNIENEEEDSKQITRTARNSDHNSHNSLTKWEFYRGCLIDSMSNPVFGSFLMGVMHPDYCWTNCNKHNMRYATFSLGFGCFCGNRSGDHLTRADESRCDIPCVGLPSMKCGGRPYTNASGVYNLKSVFKIPPEEYLGCYKDSTGVQQTVFKNHIITTGMKTWRDCLIHCLYAGYTLSGLSQGFACGCSKSLGKLVRVVASNCAFPCRENPIDQCGGPKNSSGIFTAVHNATRGFELTTTTQRTTISTTVAKTLETPSHQQTSTTETVASTPPTTSTTETASTAPPTTSTTETASTATPTTSTTETTSTAPSTTSTTETASTAPSTTATTETTSTAPSTTSTTETASTALPTTSATGTASRTHATDTTLKTAPPTVRSRSSPSTVQTTTDYHHDHADMIGCFSLPLSEFNDVAMPGTLEGCLEYCRYSRYRFAAIAEAGFSCICNHYFTRIDPVESSRCNRSCIHETSKICGGDRDVIRNIVYSNLYDLRSYNRLRGYRRK